MDNDKLILYLDSDYILPIVASSSESFTKYYGDNGIDDENRLPLYFFYNSVEDKLVPKGQYKALYESRTAGYIGDFWSMMDNNPKAKVGNTPISVEDLLASSGIIKALKAMYSDNGRRKEVDIPTVYIFAKNIGEKARLNFLEYMESKSFKTITYSTKIETLAIDYILRTHPEIDVQFAERVVVFESSSNDMVASTYAYDGIDFVSVDAGVVLDGAGNSPVKRALVEYVVSSQEAINHFLNQEELALELNYQMQFVDLWLANQGGESTPNFQVRMHYRQQPGIDKYVMVNKSIMRNKQTELIDELLHNMYGYKNKNAAHDMTFAVLLGQAFEDPIFTDKVKANIGTKGNVYYLNELQMPYVLAYYMDVAPDVVESVADFNKIQHIEQDNLRHVDEWLSNARKLRELETSATTLLDDSQENLSKFEKIVGRTSTRVDQLLKTPGGRFNDARKCFEDSDLVNAKDKMDSCISRLDSVRKTRERERSTIDSVRTFGGAKQIIDRINDSLTRLDDAQRKYMDCVRQNIEEILEEINRLEICYPEYQRLIQSLGKATIVERRRIVNDITERRLTREELPNIEINPEFTAKISAKVDTKSSGIIFKSKTKTIDVSITIPSGQSTPCDTVLIIQSRPLVSIDEQYIRERYEKGTSGTLTYNADLSKIGLKDASKLYIYLKPDPDERGLGINALNIDSLTINL